MDLKYSIMISATREHVYKTMTEPETYKKWARAFSPKSRYIGAWEQGSTIDFIDPDLGGTRALLEEVDPPARIQARHISLIGVDGKVETEGDVAGKWIDTIESYTLIGEGEDTHVIVDIRTHDDFAAMFDEGWAKALPALKKLCEEAVL